MVETQKLCFFLRKLSDDFQPQGKKWLKIQPQKHPVAKFVVAGHRCPLLNSYNPKTIEHDRKCLKMTNLQVRVQ